MSNKNTNKTTTTIPPPKEWPDVITERYTALRVLGQGGFASVVLAKVKVPPTQKDTTNVPSLPSKVKEEAVNKNNGLVAIKVAGNAKDGVSKSERAYGHREVDILQAISHPNIMKCLDYVEPTTPGKGMILVLSYSKGPTVESLIKHGGALSNDFGRVVIAQMVDAICYLHSHAVVHRDIKPDNIIVTGALSTQAEIWDNPDNYDTDDEHAPQGLPNWQALFQKWHVTLVDFGFARALTPQDVIQPSIEYQRENLDASFHANKIEHLDTSSGELSSLGGNSGGRRRRSLMPRRGSLSNRLHRQMSALGTSQFAAPEIKKVSRTTSNNLDNSKDITNTISTYVADYGLLVDAYSLGCTIRYMMTGCPPHVSVSQAIANQQSLVEQLCGLFCMNPKKQHKGTSGDTNGKHRTPRYRYVDDLPGEVQRLIRQLMQPEESKRSSVRAARRYHWIRDVLPSNDNGNNDDNKTTTAKGDDQPPIQYLDFVLQKNSNGKTTEDEPQQEQRMAD